MAAIKFFAQAAVMALVLTYIEKKCLPENIHAFLSSSSPAMSPAMFPRAFGLLILVLSGISLWLISHSLSIGRSRLKYMELASKDGEAHVKERYGLPNLYVEGVSKHARAFNCVQRSHQQTLESFPQFLFFSISASLCFPLTSTITCALWWYARVVWTNGYAKSEGDPAQRYSHPFSRFIWTGLLVQFLGSIMTALNILLSSNDNELFW